MRIRLTSQTQKDHACQVIQGLPDGKKVIKILDDKDIRSNAQNSLYWVWVTQLAGEQGLTKDEVHHYLKEKFLVRIYERDDPDGYGAMIESIRKVWRSGDKLTAMSIKDQVVDLTSTTNAEVPQFSEFLDDIDKDSIGKGIYLSRPEDLYREAMGQ